MYCWAGKSVFSILSQMISFDFFEKVKTSRQFFSKAKKILKNIKVVFKYLDRKLEKKILKKIELVKSFFEKFNESKI